MGLLGLMHGFHWAHPFSFLEPREIVGWGLMGEPCKQLGECHEFLEWRLTMFWIAVFIFKFVLAAMFILYWRRETVRLWQASERRRTWSACCCAPTGSCLARWATPPSGLGAPPCRPSSAPSSSFSSTAAHSLCFERPASASSHFVHGRLSLSELITRRIFSRCTYYAVALDCVFLVFFSDRN